LKNRYEEIRSMCAIAEGRGGLNLKIVGNIQVIVPDIEEQKQFINFAEQSDKSKYYIQMGKKRIDKEKNRCLMKMILNN
jgi:restriction endonuclease S subunit